MTVLVKREWFKRGISRRLVRERGDMSWSRFGQTAGLLALAFATAIFYIWQHLWVMSTGYELENLRGRLTTLRTENSLLEVESASLEDLRIMEKRAVWELEMIRPEPGQVIYGCGTGDGDDQEE